MARISASCYGCPAAEFHWTGFSSTAATVLLFTPTASIQCHFPINTCNEDDRLEDIVHGQVARHETELDDPRAWLSKVDIANRLRTLHLWLTPSPLSLVLLLSPEPIAFCATISNRDSFLLPTSFPTPRGETERGPYTVDTFPSSRPEKRRTVPSNGAGLLAHVSTVPVWKALVIFILTVVPCTLLSDHGLKRGR